MNVPRGRKLDLAAVQIVPQPPDFPSLPRAAQDPLLPYTLVVQQHQHVLRTGGRGQKHGEKLAIQHFVRAGFVSEKGLKSKETIDMI